MEAVSQLINQLFWVLGLLGIAVGIAVWQRLDNWLGLALAGLRAALQLFVFSYLLAMVIWLRDPLTCSLAIVGFLLIATALLNNQLHSKVPLRLLSFLSLGLGMSLTLAYAVVCVLPTAVWYEPQILLPLSGVVLANVSSGSLIAAERLTHHLTYNANSIETALCLGSSAKQAIAHYRQEAIQAAITPNMAALGILGLGTLPGFMAGGLWGGANPFSAAIAQLLVMAMSLVATLISTLLLCHGIQRQFFSDADQLQQW